jgi:hypothetical protein
MPSSQSYQLTVRGWRWLQSGMPAGHLLEVYEGEFKGADYSTCERYVPLADPWPPRAARPSLSCAGYVTQPLNSRKGGCSLRLFTPVPYASHERRPGTTSLPIHTQSNHS